MRFANITYFAAGWVVFFGLLYQRTYRIAPRLFVFSNPPFAYSATYVNHGWRIFLELGQFIVYSGTVALCQTHPSLHSNSTLISILNIIEELGWLLMIGVLVATFVNLAKPTKSNIE